MGYQEQSAGIYYEKARGGRESKGRCQGKQRQRISKSKPHYIKATLHKATLHIVVCVYRGSHDDHDDGYFAHGSSLSYF